MHDLIEQLEAATEGSRELDACVWVAVNGKGQPMKKVGPPSYKEPRFFCNPDPGIDWIGYDLLRIAPNYTTSLDAALTLVPEGMKWCISDLGQIGAEDWAFAGVYGSPMVGSECDTNARTPALALCIAALKARQHGSVIAPEGTDDAS